MKLNSNKFAKTAASAAVFYFATFHFSSTAFAVENNLDAVKKKVLNLLIQKQKKQALAYVDDYITVEKNKANLKEAKDFKISIAKKFLTKEAQESYELSINQTLDSAKEAKKSNEDCLSQEPENLDCQIQKLRLAYRENPKRPNERAEAEKVNKYFSDNDINWVKLSLEKSAPEFKNANFYKKEVGPLTEEKLVKSILEVDRAFMAKNFSKAKEILQMIEKEYPDWPDLVFFKQVINVESAENNKVSATEVSNLYQTKCKNLSKTISRKYRYDFDLCMRGTL